MEKALGEMPPLCPKIQRGDQVLEDEELVADGEAVGELVAVVRLVHLQTWDGAMRARESV